MSGVRQGDRIYHDKDWLQSQFDSGKILTEIADDVGVNHKTIEKWANRLDVDYTPANTKPVGDGRYRDKEWMQEQLDKGIRPSDISDKTGTSIQTVCKWIKKFDLDYEDGWEYQTKGDGQYKEEEFLREKYHDEKMSMPEIADECGVALETIRYWMNKNSIERRSKSDATKLALPENFGEIHSERISGENHPYYGLTGEDHPAWKGGHDWRDSGKWDEVRHEVYQRDDLTCQDCGATDTVLHAHHLTPVNDGGDKYDMENLVTLCKNCHFSVHSSTESDWIEVSA